LFGLPVPVDARLIVAVAAVVLAGFAKSVTGMGLPVLAVPILVALYGDLRLVLLCTTLGTVLTDPPMLWRYRAHWRESRMLVGFLLAGIVGMVIGTHLLAYVHTAVLAGILAAVVIAFIVISLAGREPTMPRTVAARVGPLVGLICGMLQGSAGAAGPVTTSYLVSTRMPRAAFLFAINAIFFTLDATQFVSLQSLHLTTPQIWTAGAGIFVLCAAGLGIGFALQSRIDDVAFKRGVLVMLAVAAAGLIVRAARG
jgi:uncharacterized membrane protein YfcA